MSIYHTFPYCGAALDPGEACDCVNAQFARLTPENREKINVLVARLMAEQKNRPSATNTETANIETTSK